MGLFQWLSGWTEVPKDKIPKWISRSRKINKAHYFATHRQTPGTTAIYHLKGKNYVYKIKVRSTGQYSDIRVFSKKLT